MLDGQSSATIKKKSYTPEMYVCFPSPLVLFNRRKRKGAKKVTSQTIRKEVTFFPFFFQGKGCIQQ
jgi:hypothetical protein